MLMKLLGLWVMGMHIYPSFHCRLHTWSGREKTEKESIVDMHALALGE